VIAMLLATSTAALAQASIPIRNMLVKWSGQMPLLSFSAEDFVTERVASKLDSGLPQRIVTRVYAYPERDETPISVSAQSCRVVFDLWEGVYRVQQQTTSTDRTLTLPDRQAVVRTCLDVKAMALGEAAAFQPRRGRKIYFAAIVELNPLSPDTVQRIRRWLSKTGSGQLRGDAFFGSFVSIFVSRRLGTAEHTLSFRSGTFSVPP
jgi:hypothetical protein